MNGFNNAYNFILFYIIVNFLFSILLIISYQLRKNFYNIVYITDLLNLRFYITFFIYSLFIITIAMILGIPPFTNFFIKYNLILELTFHTIYYYYLVGIILTTVISTFYYIRLLKIIFFDFNLNLVTDINNTFNPLIKNSYKLIKFFSFYTLFIYFYFIKNIIQIKLNIEYGTLVL
jgi:NADH:ubiquinone oxidoreductase subunit 2 (subunit N)